MWKILSIFSLLLPNILSLKDPILIKKMDGLVLTEGKNDFLWFTLSCLFVLLLVAFCVCFCCRKHSLDRQEDSSKDYLYEHRLSALTRTSRISRGSNTDSVGPLWVTDFVKTVEIILSWIESPQNKKWKIWKILKEHPHKMKLSIITQYSIQGIANYDLLK